MDKSTGYPVKDRRHSLRVLCMLMLVLMHLDIYGGSVMSLLDAPSAPVACRQSLPVSDAGAEEAVGGAYEEWADPDYRCLPGPFISLRCRTRFPIRIPMCACSIAC